MEAIEAIETRLFHLPLDEVLVDAKHGDHTHFELVTATVRLADGAEGTGYTYTGGRGGHAIRAMIDHDLAPVLQGRDGTEVETLHDAMGWHVHYVGRGGIAAFAISAVDVALWDLRGKREGRPLWRMAGGASRSCRAYRGGIDLGFDTPKLLRSVEGHLAQGFEGVKIKVGRHDDRDRAAAVRKAIGPDTAFMVDANYAFTVAEAIERARGFAEHDVLWFEEPTIPDDYAGYGRIAREGGVPLAMGENLHTIHEFDHAFERAGLSFVQPDASNCGGITGFLRVAERAARHGVALSSHGMHELHASLVAGQGAEGWIEVHAFPIDRYTTRPFALRGGRAEAPDEPGIGVAFDWDRLQREEEIGKPAR